jgi:hypothetical protein
MTRNSASGGLRTKDTSETARRPNLMLLSIQWVPLWIRMAAMYFFFHFGTIMMLPIFWAVRIQVTTGGQTNYAKESMKS